MKYLSFLLGIAALALLAAGWRGMLLVERPAQGEIMGKLPDAEGTSPTVRSRGPVFTWMGGGYHRGK